MTHPRCCMCGAPADWNVGSLTDGEPDTRPACSDTCANRARAGCISDEAWRAAERQAEAALDRRDRERNAPTDGWRNW